MNKVDLVYIFLQPFRGNPIVENRRSSATNKTAGKPQIPRCESRHKVFHSFGSNQCRGCNYRYSRTCIDEPLHLLQRSPTNAPRPQPVWKTIHHPYRFSGRYILSACQFHILRLWHESIGDCHTYWLDFRDQTVLNRYRHAARKTIHRRRQKP